MTKKKQPQKCITCIREKGKSRKFKNLANHTRIFHERRKQLLSVPATSESVFISSRSQNGISQEEPIPEGVPEEAHHKGTETFVSLFFDAHALRKIDEWIIASNGRFKTAQEVVGFRWRLAQALERLNDPESWVHASEGRFRTEDEVREFWSRLRDFSPMTKAEVKQMLNDFFFEVG